MRVELVAGSDLELKPQAAVATLWRALVIGFVEPNRLAATKALRSRAESRRPFGTKALPRPFALSPIRRFAIRPLQSCNPRCPRA